ncbi:ABC transporter permease [uncultured Sphaerochaeta sp.]|uniref:ABC transporter permease n=1 Tax=uncultured Sphaerochaeta sp. TaxID=886478 RepID=UPI002A0A2D09|nr:ABC transporter permease [uncultured Sphaerochaeta sp.]
MKKAGLFLLVIWYILSALAGKPFLPYPHQVAIHTLWALFQGSLPKHFGISALRIALALVSAAIPSFLLGLAAGRDRKTDRLLTPFAYILYPIPKVALLPVIMLFLGLGNLSKIFLIGLIVFFQLYFVVRDASEAVDERYMDSVRSLGASRLELLKHVVVPAVLPSLFTALKVSTGTATAVLFLAETFATTTGLGWYIMDSWARMDYLDMYAGMVALSLLGTGFFVSFSFLEKKLCPWKHVRDRDRSNS